MYSYFVLCIDCFVSFSVLFVCIFVLYYCHRVATQLQLTNISYHIICRFVVTFPIFSKTLTKIFLILRIIRRHIIMNEHMSARKAHVIHFRFYPGDFRKVLKNKISLKSVQWAPSNSRRKEEQTRRSEQSFLAILRTRLPKWIHVKVNSISRSTSCTPYPAGNGFITPSATPKVSAVYRPYPTTQTPMLIHSVSAIPYCIYLLEAKKHLIVTVLNCASEQLLYYECP